MELSQITHSDFLNQFCQGNESRYPHFNDQEKIFLSQITAAEWISWLNKQNGRNKLVNLVNNNTKKKFFAARSHQISYIKTYILQLSVNDYSRLTDSLWSSIPMDDKKIVQSVLTLPYPFINDDNLQLEFSDINIPIWYKELQPAINTAVHILLILEFDVHKSLQIMRFIELVIKAINDQILNERGDVILFELYDKMDTLFAILLHPDHHDKIKGLNIFLKYMTDAFKKYMFFTDEQYRFTSIRIFVNSSESYLKELSTKNQIHRKGFIKIHDKEEEEEEIWWGKICEDIFISPLKYNYAASILNKILVENPIFMDKMMQCTKKIRWNYNESMSLWVIASNKLTEQDIFDGSFKAGLVAKLLYEVIGIPCLDALSSDSYVNSLSDDDKELLTLWTHACSLFQNKRKKQEQEEQENDDKETENDEIQDLSKIPWLRNRLHYIFMQAPKTKAPLFLFRGINVKCNRLIKKSSNPLAVTFDKNIARGFSSEGRGCFLKVTVPENTNILAIDRVSVYEQGEGEILLMPNSTLYIQGDSNSNTNEDENEIVVIYKTESNEKSNIVPLPKPSFQHREMTWKEFETLLIKSNILYNTQQPLDISSILIQLYTVDSRDYIQVSDLLFNSIRTWQIIYCGFGDIKLAISEFWKLYLQTDVCLLPLSNETRYSLQQLKIYCDIAWTSRKSLARQSKIAMTLDTLQKFVRPFVQKST